MGQPPPKEQHLQVPGLHLPEAGLTRSRRALFGDLASLAVSPLVLGVSACASIVGDHTFDTYFVVKPSHIAGTFSSFTDINIGTTPGPDDHAVIIGAIMSVPDGFADFSFLKSFVGKATNPLTGEVVPVLSGANFAPGDTSEVLQILYEGDIQPFFNGGEVVRLNWDGTIDGNQVPAAGVNVTLSITVDIS